MSEAAKTLAMLEAHAWQDNYDDYAPSSAPVGKWGYRCKCGEFMKGQAAHRTHLAALLAANTDPAPVPVAAPDEEGQL